MENLTFVETNSFYGKETHAVIEHADGSFTSMLKSTYEASQVEQATLASELSNPSTPQAGE
jgi:hypothetical protein